MSRSAISTNGMVPMVDAATLESDRQQSQQLHQRLANTAHKRLLLGKRPIYEQGSMKAAKVPESLQQTNGSRDLVQKSSRTGVKRKFLFLLPFRISCKASGKQMGVLHQMATRNPIIYINFTQGRIKLFGTLLSSDHTYLAVQYPQKRVSASANPLPMQVKNAFTRVFVFSEWRWVGTLAENPSEKELPLPADISVEPRRLPVMPLGGSAPQSSGSQRDSSPDDGMEEKKEFSSRSKMVDLDEDDGVIDLVDGDDDDDEDDEPAPPKPSTKRKRPTKVNYSGSDDDADEDMDIDDEPSSTPTTSQRARRASVKPISYAEKDEEEEPPSESSSSSENESMDEAKGASDDEVDAPKPKSKPESKESKSETKKSKPSAAKKESTSTKSSSTAATKSKPKAKASVKPSQSSSSSEDDGDEDSDEDEKPPKKKSKKSASATVSSITASIFASKKTPVKKAKSSKKKESDDDSSEFDDDSAPPTSQDSATARPRRAAATVKVNYAVDKSDEEEEEEENPTNKLTY